MKSVYDFGLSGRLAVWPSVRLSVWPYVRALTGANMHRLLWNLYTLLMFTRTCSLLKMKCVVIILQLQEHSKVFFNITVYGGKSITMHFSNVTLFQLLWNLYPLLMVTKPCSTLKMKCVMLIFQLQEHSKVFFNVTVYGERSFALHFRDVTLFQLS